MPRGGAKGGGRGGCEAACGAASAFATTLLVVAASLLVPLEQLLNLSATIVPSFPWYLWWRVAAATLLLWLLSSFLASKRRVAVCWLTAFSAVTFAAAHYAVVLTESAWVEVRLLPLVYAVGRSGAEVYRLDLAQVALLTTLLWLSWDRIKRAISRTPPRTSSSRRPSHSRR